MRPFSYLDEGKQWLMGLLQRKGFYDIQETSQYAHWDIEAKYKGKQWIFELKNRNFSSLMYGDVILEVDKVRHMTETPYRAIFVNFWTDKWCMIDVRTVPYEVEYRNHQKTTRFEDTRVIRTAQATWRDIKKLDYE